VPAGALEAERFFDAADILFSASSGELLQAVHGSLTSHLRAAVAISFSTPQLWTNRALVTRLRSLFGSRAVYFHAGGK